MSSGQTSYQKNVEALTVTGTLLSVGATIASTTASGTVVPFFGNIVGFVAGVGIALVNVAKSLLAAQDQIKQLKKAEFYDQIKKYNQSIFAAAINRMGPAMEELVTLGLKPGSTEFDYMLTQKLQNQVGYQGNCKISLNTTSTSGQLNSLATIDKDGNVEAPQQGGQLFDYSNGPIWAKACKDLHLAALKMWASNQKDSIEYHQLIQDQKQHAMQIMLTAILVSTGLGMFLIGFILRNQGKIYAKK